MDAARPFDLGTIGRGLVFADSLDALATALDDAASSAVVQAPPGTGKTTLVPPLLANLVWLGATGGTGFGGGTEASGSARAGGGRVVVTQPRRVAARAAARRLAFLDGSRPGERVAHTVRGESTAGPETLIEFVTPGILLRRLLADPALPNVTAVILDEVHERGLETDLLVGMLAEVRQLRGDLRLVAMSATVDAHRFAALLGGGGGDPGAGARGGERGAGVRGGARGAGSESLAADHDDAAPAAVVDCPAALHPLEVKWAPAPGPRLDERGVTRQFLAHVADTAASAHARALAEDSSVDALVFLPGAWEVSEVAARLRTMVGRLRATDPPGTDAPGTDLPGTASPGLDARGPAAPTTEVLELHGQVDAREQDRAVSGREPGGPPRSRT